MTDRSEPLIFFRPNAEVAAEDPHTAKVQDVPGVDPVEYLHKWVAENELFDLANVEPTGTEYLRPVKWMHWKPCTPRAKDAIRVHTFKIETTYGA